MEGFLKQLISLIDVVRAEAVSSAQVYSLIIARTPDLITAAQGVENTPESLKDAVSKTMDIKQVLTEDLGINFAGVESDALVDILLKVSSVKS